MPPPPLRRRTPSSAPSAVGSSTTAPRPGAAPRTTAGRRRPRPAWPFGHAPVEPPDRQAVRERQGGAGHVWGHPHDGGRPTHEQRPLPRRDAPRPAVTLHPNVRPIVAELAPHPH